MVVNGLEHLLRGDQEGSHFPNGHFEIHLGKLEQPGKFVSQIRPLLSLPKSIASQLSY